MPSLAFLVTLLVLSSVLVGLVRVLLVPPSSVRVLLLVGLLIAGVLMVWLLVWLLVYLGYDVVRMVLAEWPPSCPVTRDHVRQAHDEPEERKHTALGIPLDEVHHVQDGGGYPGQGQRVLIYDYEHYALPPPIERSIVVDGNKVYFSDQPVIENPE